MCGALVTAGRSTTILVPAEPAGGEAPFTLVARTVERTTWPPSAVVSLYVVLVAPEMSTQRVPVDAQRCPSEEYGAPPAAHEPVEVVSVRPTIAVPLMVGAL